MLDRTGPDETQTSGGALREALRRARAEAAQQTEVVVDLRAAEVGRLELLREELVPLFAQVPREIDIFDLGLAPRERPRLFVDMVSFVEMGHDRRTYRFMRDGRNGRAAIAESENVDKIVEAVTSYVARRLVERERLLADDDRIAALGNAPASAQPVAPAAPLPPVAAPPAAPEAPVATAASPSANAFRAAGPAAPAARKGGWRSLIKVLVSMGVGLLLGSLVVGVLMYAVAAGLISI
ncbi:hypothetical protein [Methylopila sp. M107]|uniref:hypothetical protein n=1 Tax=Methylopila sp. M107 TaxID=1101190 RepID=UPI000382E141|nr:hypothetical protein [Methylopila sp. M107]